jgi:hypothetical protein
MSTGDLSLRVKWPGREADHSPPSSAEVKKAWIYISTPQYAFMAWCLVKAQGKLYLYLRDLQLLLWSLKVNVKLSLYLNKYHAMKAYWGVEV